MNILVTGTEGYLGSLLAPLLMRRGHDVTGLDTGYYKTGWLYNGTPLTARTLNKDLRHVVEDDLRGADAIVHMAELSNDPTGQLSPNITYEINHKGSVRLAELAKRAGVTRFVYTDVDRDGMLEGPDLDEVRRVGEAVRGRFLYSGGIGALADLEALRDLRLVNLAGVISGKALYEGRFGVAEGQAALEA